MGDIPHPKVSTNAQSARAGALGVDEHDARLEDPRGPDMASIDERKQDLVAPDCG